MKEHLVKHLLESLIPALGALFLVFLYNLLYSVPARIYRDANEITITPKHSVPPPPSEFAYDRFKNNPKRATTPLRRPPLPVTIVMQLPSMGNLKQRAISLSEEIMGDLYRNGWRFGHNTYNKSGVQPMPTTPDENIKWRQDRSIYFRSQRLERVLEIKNEFAQLHLRDRGLDVFLEYQFDSQRLDFKDWGKILPQEIERVASQLKALAEQINYKY